MLLLSVLGFPGTVLAFNTFKYNREKAEAFVADLGYQSVAAIRHQAATTNMIIVEGWPGD